jgi:hypothetical protein
VGRREKTTPNPYVVSDMSSTSLGRVGVIT